MKYSGCGMAAVCFLTCVCFASNLMASPGRDVSPAKPAHDSIDIVGHLALKGAEITAITASTHWRHDFVQLADDVHRTLTLVDITDPTQPALFRQFNLPAGMAAPGVEAMVGNAALIADGPRADRNTPKSLSIVDFSDPGHPVTQRKFEKVTALTDLPGGLVCLVDSGELWILKEHPAPDAQLEADYGKYVLYGLH